VLAFSVMIEWEGTSFWSRFERGVSQRAEVGVCKGNVPSSNAWTYGVGLILTALPPGAPNDMV
jgi:hypothetical protein